MATSLTQKRYRMAALLAFLLVGFAGLYAVQAQCGFSLKLLGPRLVCGPGPYTYSMFTVPALSPPFTIKWSNDDSVSTTKYSFPIPNSITTVSVTVTDNNGCSVTRSIQVTRVAFTLEMEAIPDCANGGVGTVSAIATPGLDLASTDDVMFNWEAFGPLPPDEGPAGSSVLTSTVQTLYSGPYSVTVTLGQENCISDVIDLEMFEPPVPTITGPPGLCPDETVPLTAGPGSYNAYQWSTGSTDPETSATGAGTYQVTVTDANGCTGTDAISLTAYPVPIAFIQGPSVLQCYQNVVNLSVLGTFTSYEWSTGATTANTLSNGPGLYTVTVTNNFGCTGEASRYLGQFTLPSPLINASSTTVCPGDTVVLTAGTALPHVLWSTGDTTTSIRVTAGGLYTITVTSGLGCTATAERSITALPGPQASLATPAPLCPGASTTLAVTGGPFAHYSWSTSDTTASIIASQPGAYAVTVVNTQGCRKHLPATIPAASSVNLALSVSPYTCNNALSISATTGLTAYSWSNGANTESITVGATGAYAVTATNSAGCTGTASINAFIPTPPTVTITGPTSICSGSSATFGLAGSFGGAVWSTGAITSTITAAAPGSYSVTVTGDFGCTATASIDLAVGGTIQTSIAELPYACDNLRTLDAGAGYATYLWSTNATTPTITVTDPGSYAVTVSDASGCTGVATVNATIPPSPKVNVSGPASLCPGTPAMLEASPGFALYQWSNGPVAAVNSVGGPGTYSVTATDGYGCSTTSTFVVAALPVPAPELFGPVSLCAGASATLYVGGGAFAGYSWSTAAISDSIEIQAAGTYSVTVVNAEGCTASASQTVTLAPAPAPTVAPLPYACDGTITIEVTGVLFPGYQWTTGSTLQRTTVSVSGEYTVTVTDVNGCTAAVTTAVVVPALPAVTIEGPTTICAVGGSVELTATDGFASYEWSTGDQAQQIVVDVAGDYGVTVTDVYGCTATALTALEAVTELLPQLLGPAGVCPGATAEISVEDTSLIGYVWSTGATTAVLSPIGSGDYSVTVTDAGGCTGTGMIHIDAFAAPDPQPAALPYDCTNQLTLEAPGNFTAWTWTTGSTTAGTTVQAAGTYTVTVTDANGCTGVQSLTVEIPTNPSVAITGVSPLCPQASGTLDATAGLTAYEWSTAATTPSISIDQPGVYSVTATDANGCTATATTMVESAVTNFVAAVAPAVCLGSALTLEASGGTAYQWTGPNNFSSTAPSAVITNMNDLAAGEYKLLVTDTTSGCSATYTFNVAVLTPPTIVSNVPSTVCLNAGTVTLSADPADGTWSGPGVASGIFDPLAVGAGGYVLTYTATSADGCTAVAMVEIVVDVCLSTDEASAGGGWRIYPNPSTGRFTLEYAGATAIRDLGVELYDVTGRRVSALAGGDLGAGATRSVDFGRVPAGTYQLRLRAGGQMWTERVVIVR